MLTYIIIFGFALLGGSANGLEGFFSWGLITYWVLFAFDWLVDKVISSLLPRYVLVDTAEDFVAAHRSLVRCAYPSLGLHDAKEKIVQLLEDMFVRAKKNRRPLSRKYNKNVEIFLISALEIAHEQTDQSVGDVAVQLVNFVRGHPLWYGREVREFEC